MKALGKNDAADFYDRFTINKFSQGVKEPMGLSGVLILSVIIFLIQSLRLITV
jgi:hypothetical protein